MGDKLSITLARYSVPAAIFYMARKRRKKIPYRRVFEQFGGLEHKDRS